MEGFLEVGMREPANADMHVGMSAGGRSA